LGKPFFVATLASPGLGGIGPPALTLIMDQFFKIVGGLNLFAICLIGSSRHLKKSQIVLFKSYVSDTVSAPRGSG
jgi:hypothetical protein